eukprot:10846864-Prorocentrum_lima.AAC.1
MGATWDVLLCRWEEPGGEGVRCRAVQGREEEGGVGANKRRRGGGRRRALRLKERVERRGKLSVSSIAVGSASTLRTPFDH